MNATDRIVEEFNRQVALGRKRIAARPYAERVVYFVVAARCEIDMEGFESVYEQAFTASELTILIDGLRSLGKEDLAAGFARGLEMLQQEGYYEHLDWKKVSADTRRRIAEIGERIGDQLWNLDEKLVEILDAGGAAGDPDDHK